MKRSFLKSLYSVVVFVVVTLTLSACGTTKNTGASRTWHAMKTVHNVYFNGQNAYKDGTKAIDNAHVDDFSDVLPLYPVSDHQAATASASNMDKAIEKSRKCIKLHSIHAKPKVKSEKLKDPKYKRWVENKEFNPQMYRAWLMLAQSEFHKG